MGHQTWPQKGETMQHDSQPITTSSEKLQVLKVLERATQFLKDHDGLTPPVSKRFCAITIAWVLEGSDQEAEEDWDALLTAVDASAVEVSLEDDDPFLAGLF
jgi:hypothetical protein